ncbi:MAG: hypothetical protein K9N01_16015 [Cephaloticoccus sp.]|nr:hypothetical protein [Cephaloticoccus sp.]
MSKTSAPFYREPRQVRPIRFFALFLLVLALTLICGLALLSTFPLLQSSMEILIGWQTLSDAPKLAGWLTVALIILMPTLLLIVMWRYKLRSWWWVGGGWLLTAPMLIYLAVDDAAVIRTASIQEISPAFPGAEDSFEVLMRYGRSTAAAQNFNPPPIIRSIVLKSNESGDEWRDALIKNRARLEAEWLALAPQREWWTELNRFDRIGDLTLPTSDADIPSFTVFNTLSKRGWAMAGLLAIDGRGDEAIDALIPILQVGRKLQPSARTLVRMRMGITIEAGSIRTAEWILANAEVSPDAKARLAAALEGSGGEKGARRLIMAEYAMEVGYYAELPFVTLIQVNNIVPRTFVRIIKPFVFNRRATANLYTKHAYINQELAAKRSLKAKQPMPKYLPTGSIRPTFKNYMGTMIINNLSFNPTNAVDSYWKNEDARADLHARLTAI